MPRLIPSMFPEFDYRDHARSCIATPHPHGTNCSSWCPTCSGQAKSEPTARDLINELTKLDPDAYKPQPRPAHRAITPNDNEARPTIHILRPNDIARAMSSAARTHDVRGVDGSIFWLVLARKLEAEGYVVMRLDPRNQVD